MCKDLVRLTTQDVSKSIPITDSKIIAEKFELKHSVITRNIRKYKEDFEEFGEVQFMVLKTENSNGGRPEKVYLLNEMQYSLLVTFLRNTPKVIEYKKKFVKAFFLATNELKARIETRHIGKSKRINFTDSVKKNVIGEGNFKNYAYSNYTKLVYKKIIGMTVKKYKEKNNIPKQSNIRDYFNIDQIEQIQELESKIATYIEMRKDTGETDKEIYQEVKKYLEKLED